MKLEVNDEQLTALVSRVMLEELDQEQRDKLMQGAIASLLKRGYDDSNQLQRSYGLAVAQVATEIAREAIAETHREQIKQCFAEAAERALLDTDNREKLIESLANSIRRAVTGERY